MSLAKALIMSIILLVGGLYVWKYESFEKPPEEGAEQATPLFPNLKVDDFARVAVKGAGIDYSLMINADSQPGPLWVGSLRDMNWVLEQPNMAPVDKNEIADVLGAIVELKARNIINANDVSDDLAQYGLAEPELTLSFRSSRGDKEVLFGNKHPISGRRYAKITDDKAVYLVDERLAASLKKKEMDIRDTRPLAFDSSEANELLLSREEGGNLRFYRDDDRKKWFVAGESQVFEADENLVVRMLRDLSSFSVASFVEGGFAQPKLYGLEPAMARVAVRFNEKGDSAQELVALFGEAESLGLNDAGKMESQKRLYFKLANEKWIYEAKSGALPNVTQPLSHFRSKLPFSDVSANGITKLIISDTKPVESKFGFERNADGVWRAVNGAEKEISSQAISDWLQQLVSLRVIGYPGVDYSVLTVGSPGGVLRRIEFTLGESGKTYVLALGAPLAENSPAMPQGEQKAQTPEEPPILGAVREGDGVHHVVVISSVDVEHLDKPESFFRSQ